MAVVIWHIQINVNVHWSQPLQMEWILFFLFARTRSKFNVPILRLCSGKLRFHSILTHKCYIFTSEVLHWVRCIWHSKLQIIKRTEYCVTFWRRWKKLWKWPSNRSTLLWFFPIGFEWKKSTPIKDIVYFNSIQWKNWKDWKIHEKNKSTLNGNNKLQRRTKATWFNFRYVLPYLCLVARAFVCSFVTTYQMALRDIYIFLFQ